MHGFKVIVSSSVGLARDMDEAARLLAAAYSHPQRHEHNVRVRVRATLTRDRDLTYEEHVDLVRRTAVIVAAKEAA